jgi:diguanylate cyclase (GGDEF)-like protein/PAS domain S-box-containing protein
VTDPHATNQYVARLAHSRFAMTQSLPPDKIDDDAVSKLKLLADHIPALIAYFRASDYVCEFCNQAYASTYGLTVKDAIGKTVAEIIGQEATTLIRPYMDRALTGERVSYQRPIVSADGLALMIEVTLIPHWPLGTPPDDPSVALVLIHDVTKFHHAERAIRDSEERQRKFADATTEAIVFHERGVIVDANQACANLIKLPIEKMIGTNVLNYVAPESVEIVASNIRLGYERPYEGSVLRGDGTTVSVEFVGRILRYEGKTHRMTVVRDISERKAAEARIQFLAHHDALTHLPNRALMMDRIQVLLSTARRHGTMLAVAFVDLDHFKSVNDSLGHYAGDELLKRIASRLQSCVRASDLVGRLSGDEFLVVLTDLRTAEDAAPIIEKISTAVNVPFSFEAESIAVSSSIGVSVFPKDGETADSLIRAADMAMYLAKERGRNNFQYFTANLQQSASASLNLESRIRLAIKQLEFVLHYQPEVLSKTGKPSAVEALIRWMHPEQGLLGPDKFIGLAEHRGLIMPIGRWVIEEALRQARRWRDAGVSVPVAVNLSAAQFKQKDLVEHIIGELDKNGLSGEMLELELTESLFMEDVATTTKTLHRLKDLGITLAVDDFGTGYSSLSYLKRYPIDKIKIDKSFIRDIPADNDNITITRAIINLAESLNLRVVAEGVETAEQMEFLEHLNCDYIQGFLISRPIPPDDVFNWLSKRV